MSISAIRKSLFYPLALAGGLYLPAEAQIIETLQEVRITASPTGEGAGEGDLDETVLSPEDMDRFGSRPWRISAPSRRIFILWTATPVDMAA